MVKHQTRAGQNSEGRTRLLVLVGRMVPLKGKEPAGLSCAQLHDHSVNYSDQGRGTSLDRCRG
jgi:hypothetical protein